MGAPKVDTSAQDAAEARAAEAEAKAKLQEDKANESLSKTARASYGKRTGRRLLLAPGREDQLSTLN